jgi:hypothetical protein
MLGPWETWYTLCVARVHPEIVAHNSSANYIADFVDSNESAENECEHYLGVRHLYGSLIR